MTADAPRRPLFVVGYMHSGTTLLFNMLTRNDAVYSGGGETHFFELLPAIRRRFANLACAEQRQDMLAYVVRTVREGYHPHDLQASQCRVDDNALLAEIDARLPPQPQHEDCFRCGFDALAAESGKSHWVEKTPSHVYHIDQILQSIPDALFLEIVRDPRDVIASKKTRRLAVWNSERFQHGDRRRKHLQKAYDPLWDSLAWKSAVRAGRKAARRDLRCIHTIRYEDLVNAPEQTLRDLCRDAGLSFDGKMTSVETNNAADGNHADSAGGRVTAKSVGRWTRVLSEPEAQLCQWATGPERACFAYERVPTRLSAKLGVATLVVRSWGEFALRLYRRWKLGGGRFLLNVVRNYGRRLQILTRGDANRAAVGRSNNSDRM